HIEVIQHIILSHHGTLDTAFGSARNPLTPEAMMVHFIDDMDAKMMMSLSATRGDGVPSEGNWTDWMKAFSGRLFRPDVAPEEIHESGPGAVDASPKPDASSKSAGDPVKVAITNPLFESAPARNK